MSSNKERLDVILVNKGLFPSREKAKAAIMAGLVFIDGQRFDKAGTMVPIESEIQMRGDDLPFVSRGGLKLQKAIESFDLDINGKVCCDIGASTGGFTDCMLQHGASKVYAIDVGYGQLADKLRHDDRVLVMERTNIRYLREDAIPESISFTSIDVSFISLRHILPVAIRISEDDARIVCLVKPQFEAGKQEVGKGGIVREKTTHIKVLQQICEFASQMSLKVSGMTFSPVKGAKGNIEYLIYLQKGVPASDISDMIKAVVEKAHQELK